MARKLPGFRRELDARALFSVAYGEIASSIYFALGVLALTRSASRRSCCSRRALLFLIVSFSYAEGTAALPRLAVRRRSSAARRTTLPAS